jgi:hypothetical protein
MQPDEYRAFTAALTKTLQQDPRVVGLVALGSMAAVDYLPDQWSDHDFFVVTVPGVQEALRADVSWLPDSQRIAFWFREGAHALRVVYDTGHIAELVVLDETELALASANRYRVLFDGGQVSSRMAEMAAHTAVQATEALGSDSFNFGMFLVNLLVGVGRYYRGERLSGHTFVKVYALDHLLKLLIKYLPAARRDLLDNLAPSRRFEVVYPELGAKLDAVAMLAPPAAAARLLDVAEQALGDRVPAFPAAALAAARRFLERAQLPSAPSG